MLDYLMPKNIDEAISAYAIATRSRKGNYPERMTLEREIREAISAAASKAANDARAERHEQERYNGWRNYATWRINLEIWDGHDWSDERGTWNDTGELAGFLEERTDELLSDYDGGGANNLLRDYADAFVSDVDWHEIAGAIIADNPEVLAADDDSETDEEDGE